MVVFLANIARLAACHSKLNVSNAINYGLPDNKCSEGSDKRANGRIDGQSDVRSDRERNL